MENEKPSVLGIGIATIDYLLTVPSYPIKDTKIHCSSWNIQGGGNCANTLVALSRLGIKTLMYTCLGKDPAGSEIKASLEQEGVSTDNVIESGEESPLSVVIVGKNDSSRTIIHRSGVDYNCRLPFKKKILDGIDLLYSDGRFSATGLHYAEHAWKNGVPVIVEAERTGLNTEQLFPYTDILIISREYHKQVFGNEKYEKNMARLLSKSFSNRKKSEGIIILTLGKKGCICFTQDTCIRQKAYKTDVVDTTGAGDAFNAGIIYGRLMNWKIEKCLDFASRIAALKCTKPGARSGLPYVSEVIKFL